MTKFVFRLVDNLPVATRVVDPTTREESFKLGYKLGEFFYNEALINNHLNILLYYHENSDGYLIFLLLIILSCNWQKVIFVVIYCREYFRVVGFEVEPLSIDLNEYVFEKNKCSFPQTIKVRPQVVMSKGTTLYFTYSVRWKKSKVEWASRWDIYLSMKDVDIHWFSILNSLVVVCFLSGQCSFNIFDYH